MQTTNHNKFNNYTPEQLDRYIDELRQNEKDSILHICEILLEIKDRGLTHELFEHRVCQHFELIATGRITVSFVQIVEGSMTKVLKLAGYSHDILDDIANGREFEFATLKNGEIIETRKRMTSMTNAELNRVFPGNGHLSTVNEQAEKLREELALRQARQATIEAPKPAPRIQVRNGVLFLKKERFTIDELLPSLATLGYKLVKG